MTVPSQDGTTRPDVDIDAATLDLDAPVAPVASSDDAEYVAHDERLGGTGGHDEGGAG